MKTIDLAKTIKSLYEIDSLNDAAIYSTPRPNFGLEMRLRMIESSVDISLQQAESDFNHAWKVEGLPGQPAQITPENVDLIIEYLANTNGSWTIYEALKAESV